MRPPESFSTAAANRLSHSCCVSLSVAVLSFMIIGLAVCAAAGDASPTIADRAAARNVATVAQLLFLLPLVKFSLASPTLRPSGASPKAPHIAIAFAAGTEVDSPRRTRYRAAG